MFGLSIINASNGGWAGFRSVRAGWVRKNFF